MRARTNKKLKHNYRNIFLSPSPLRNLLVSALKPEYTVVEARNKSEALAMISGCDMVVTDANISDIGDGEAVARAAVAIGIQVIIHTGTLEDISDSIRKKCLYVFEKSMGSIDEIVEKIREIDPARIP